MGEYSQVRAKCEHRSHKGVWREHRTFRFPVETETDTSSADCAEKEKVGGPETHCTGRKRGAVSCHLYLEAPCLLSGLTSNYCALWWVFETSAAIKVLSLGIAKGEIAEAQTRPDRGAERRVLRVFIGCVILHILCVSFRASCLPYSVVCECMIRV